MTDRPRHDHAALIDDFGGLRPFRQAMVGCGYLVTHDQVYQWQFRGVPYRMRGAVRSCALAHGHKVPTTFLEPQEASHG